MKGDLGDIEQPLSKTPLSSIGKRLTLSEDHLGVPE